LFALVVAVIVGFIIYGRLNPKPDPGSPFNTNHLPLKYVNVFGSKMAYVDEGAQSEDAPTLVFLHGNPSSSYIWRNVIRAASSDFRCVAPDLIGMGASDKLPGEGDDRYSFVNQRKYLDELLNKVVPPGKSKDVVLVLHDWGSGLGFDWARRNENRVKGIVYFEAIISTFSFQNYPIVTQLFFKTLRAPYIGELLILYFNFFVEFAIPRQVIRPISKVEMDNYRSPYVTPGESRRATLVWPRQVPFDGQPADTHKIISDYAAWLANSNNSVPKLLFSVDPGAVLIHDKLEKARSFPHQTEIKLKGKHFVQEDCPAEMGEHIVRWVRGLH
jgi:haloalkane dehalogenase